MTDDVTSFFRLLKEVRLTPAEHAEILGEIRSLTVRTDLSPRLTRVNNTVDTLTGSLKKVSLTPKEKSQMLRTILGNGVADMEEHSSVFSIFRRFSMVPVFATSFILLLGMGGIAVAAEFAVPGDVLYPVKVTVNERVVAALSLTTESRARWNVRIAERRLEEVEVLAKTSRLSTEKAAGLRVAFQAHARKAQEDIQRVAVSDKKRGMEISEESAVSLEVHEDTITSLSHKEKEATRPQLAVMKNAVHDEVQNARRIGRMIKNADDADIQAAAALQATGSGSVEKKKDRGSKNNRHGFTLPVKLPEKTRSKESKSSAPSSSSSSSADADASAAASAAASVGITIPDPVTPSSVPGVGL